MNFATGILSFLFFFALAATVWAASSVNVNVSNKVNTSQTPTGSSTPNSANNATVKNHIEVEVNGEKKVIDDTQTGSNINSNIKVEAKSENGKTTINVSGNPQSVKSENTDQSEKTTQNADNDASNSATTTTDGFEVKEASLIDKVSQFVKDLISFVTFWD